MLIQNIYVYNDKGIRELKHVQLTETGVRIIFNLDDDLSSIQDPKIVDSKGCHFLMPGMLDSHVHGQGGGDFSNPGEMNDEVLERITQALGKTGLSYALATLVSLPIPDLKKSLAKINDFIEKQEQHPTPGCTQIVGVHLEGPFISESCKGAHAKDALQDSISMKKFREIIDAAPKVKQWKITLAADLPGAEEFIKQAKALEEEGIFVKVFIGHCNPKDKGAIGRAVAAGACGFTHLGNGCQESCSRETQPLTLHDAKSHLVQWILENPELCPPGVELISDGGVHLSPSFISLIQNTIKNKIILVTDALGPTGCPDGSYTLGSLNIRKEHNSFYLADKMGNFLLKEGRLPSGENGLVKTLAGSAAPLSFCVRKYFETMQNESVEKRMDALYTALVTNPRNTSLSMEAIHNLPDDNNFSIFDNKGQLILSGCHGKIMEHQPLHSPMPGLLSFGLLAPNASIEAIRPESEFNPVFN
ncbi:N-acetylglucosamine-6-phosphate deacetylase [Fluoribacter dumoffii]|uniref:N-acetylglucosamine-6-phosphate deacetylase n=1 Tax=Fluoribacter dumoffii TaxID=463 RepID=A0A377G8E9_9GAMM|nr:N-acetylglucosamine-6-phosphate deacetylase [Fluoribacter dumoffii]KTC89519.1 putative N-acetylglucosamine-6-phosphate deacetylase [Fluoribacter dumoffii NY 23]MCW8384710.1 N-acetylglucosamine-6-phosphate deacetylase [Fluoribacter dumoffii]MCW8417774.1 N-acetylglucosamine-6-phosphate deacetylase [Fluoribacter dumoffii]MCW8454384.1 N-acetylglucosamine-6-phosphate deacetylase [Fluoribacter dumoffii]MCW8461542.1 N-acetylglucosamine-6-phosphate deacetylase [Fluoribacter dumoffii]